MNSKGYVRADEQCNSAKKIEYYSNLFPGKKETNPMTHHYKRVLQQTRAAASSQHRIINAACIISPRPQAAPPCARASLCMPTSICAKCKTRTAAAAAAVLLHMIELRSLRARLLYERACARRAKSSLRGPRMISAQQVSRARGYVYVHRVTVAETGRIRL